MAHLINVLPSAVAYPRQVVHKLAFTVARLEWPRLSGRATNLLKRCETYPFEEQHIRSRHGVELGLHDLWSRKLTTGRLPRFEVLTDGEVRAISFATKVSAWSRLFGAAERATYLAYLRGHLTAGKSLQGPFYEHDVAGFLVAQGFAVKFNELLSTAGSHNFDLLASQGSWEVEIECKLASHDAGQPIHREQSHRLGELLVDDGWVERLPFEANRVRVFEIVLSGRFRSGHQELTRIAQALSAGVPQDLAFGRFVPLDDWKHESLGASLAVEQAKSGGHQMLWFRDNPTAGVVLLVNSTQPRKLGDAIYRPLKDAAARQFTGTRPGVLFHAMEDLDLAELPLVVSHEGHLWDQIAHRLFRNPKRSHVHSVMFQTLPTARSSPSGMETPVAFYQVSNANNDLRADSRLSWASAG